MRRRITSVLVPVVAAGMACLATSCAGGEHPAGDPPGRAEEATATNDCDPALDGAFRAWADAGFSGSVALVTGGAPDCLAGYGLADREEGAPNTPGTVFDIGSVTKAMTAAAVLDLVDAGALRLDDRAADLVPGLGGPAGDATVRQLLLHTSGITGSHAPDSRPLDRDGAVAAIGDLGSAFPPATDYGYSNAGYTLLAVIVDEVSGRGYRDVVARDVLRLPGGQVAGGFWSGEPAATGPRAIGYRDDGQGNEPADVGGRQWAIEGNGGLALTMPDLAAWTSALFGGDVVSPGAVDLLTTTTFDHGAGEVEVPGWVRYDASVYGEPMYASAGGGGDVGHDVVVAWLPESERVVAMASNTADVTAEDLLAAVGPALLAGEPLPGPAGTAPAGGADGAPVDADDLAATVGRYELDTGGSFDVTAVGGGPAVDVAAHGADAVAALFPPPAAARVAAGDLADHEARVEALLAGETPEGREERAVLEAEAGAIESVALAGTVARDGELRTYVELIVGGETVLGWYALDEHGAIAGAEVPTDPPSLTLVPAGGDRFRPDDPTGAGPDVSVTFAVDSLTVERPGVAPPPTARRSS